MNRTPADPRENLPDPESAPALPIPSGDDAGVPGDEAGVVASEPVRMNAPAHALALSALLPGAGHAVIGEWVRGLMLLLPWGVLLGLVYWTWERIVAVGGGSLDDFVAIATLAAVMLTVWGWGLWDLGLRRGRGVARGDSQWAIAMRQFKRNKPALVGLGIIIVLYLVALLAPLIAPHDPIQQIDIARLRYQPPGGEYLLGTDRFGRDVLSRIIYGSRISLSIGFVATAISVTIGTLLGASAGYFGGRIDSLIMRFTDVVLAFPRLVLLIMIVALFDGPSITIIILVLGLTQWPGTTRIVRGDVLSLREREFIHAAHALGISRSRILLRHLIPNVMAPIIVTATLGIGNTIIMEAGLSFLGLGVQPPTPTWGSMVDDGRHELIGAWWLATFPGLTIVLVVLAFNLVGDGLRDALDPRLRT
jgi:peptide/nickel transport system permease protein